MKTPLHDYNAEFYNFLLASIFAASAFQRLYEAVESLENRKEA
jgi:hypothetical protein